jgi:hypothetical protein
VGWNLGFKSGQELAKAATGSARIIGSSEKLAAFGQVAEDIYPGHGPLAGIHRVPRLN